MPSTNTKSTWHRHAGDTNDAIDVVVSKALGETLVLVSSVTATLEHRITGVTQALAALVLDSDERVVRVTLGAWLTSTAVAGDDHYVSLTLTLSDGRILTFPESLSGRPMLTIL